MIEPVRNLGLNGLQSITAIIVLLRALYCNGEASVTAGCRGGANPDVVVASRGPSTGLQNGRLGPSRGSLGVCVCLTSCQSKPLLFVETTVALWA